MKPISNDEDKPGLLEYLEDIIGSNQYQKELDENTKLQETLTEVRREKGDRMSVSKQDLDKLEDSK
jgi:structural maintenance of chromosome 4